MNKIAVCLRGEVRTWNYVKEEVFKFYENIAYSVDYYYATWDVPYLDKNELDSTFSNRNLIQGVLCPSGNDRYSWGSRLGPAFLSGHIKLNKRYDAVIDTRFDNVPVLINDQLSIPKDNEIQTAFVNQIWKHDGLFDGNVDGATCDQWAIMTQPSYDQFNYRLPLLYNYQINQFKLEKTVFKYPEIMFEKVLKEMKFELSQCQWMNNFIVRPTIVDIFPNSVDITYNDYAIVRENTYSYWDSLDVTQKIDHCTKQRIHILDYRLFVSNT